MSDEEDCVDTVTGEKPFDILTVNDVVEMMNKTTDEVKEIVKLPETTLRLLLNLYKWDSEKMLEVFFNSFSRVE